MSGVIDVGARDSRKLTVSERLYIPEILKGMVVTIRHLLRNLTHLRNLPTILYPEKRRDYSDRFRGKHVLTTRDDGTLKCVACYMCAEACPAECITIVAGEHPKLAYEKYPVVFDIDKLIAKPGLPVKDGLGYRPYYPGDGTRPPGDASSSPVIPGDGEREKLREKGFDIHHTEGPGPLNAPSPAAKAEQRKTGTG